MTSTRICAPGLLFLLSVLLSCDLRETDQAGVWVEPSLETAMETWPEMPQQITFIGLRDCLTKFQVYWNGALSCFVGRDCFGNLFPPQRELALRHEKEQLHLTFAGGEEPLFPVIDSGQVSQSLLEGYLPVIRSQWNSERISYSLQTLATALDPVELNPQKVAGMALALVRVSIRVPGKIEESEESEEDEEGEVHLWMNFAGYRTLVSTRKELPEDVFPSYGSTLHLEGTTLLDGNNRVRASVYDFPEGTELLFHQHFGVTGPVSEPLERAENKGFLKNLLQVNIPCRPGEEVTLTISLPYFPAEIGKSSTLNRDFSEELNRVRAYWGYFYERDAQLETPEPVVNDLYRSGLWRTLVTSDRDPESGITYIKSSPAWYETIWPNCAMVSAVSVDMRGFQDVGEAYLEPFIRWQSVREPPNMKGASKEGFLCPPAEYCAIPWVSNHGNILWAMCEHFRISGDRKWAEKILEHVLAAADWIMLQREQTRNQEYGAGMLPGGTVSDDRGSGQYLCSDAQNYRGLSSAAGFLRLVNHPRAGEISEAAERYREDIVSALTERTENNDSVLLVSGEKIPYVPAEIHQSKPPVFDPYNFWPYINYIDVGPMHLVDCSVLEGNSDLARWILRFESQYPVTRLDHPISLTENWVRSIRMEGRIPATLLYEGISTVEPFYAPRSTMFLEDDRVEDYLHLFYNQLAAGVSHRNLAPCENRYGVWNMPWADGEYHRMLMRMLVYEQHDTLFLLRAIPRRWLEDGKVIRVARQPTTYGKIGLEVQSHLGRGRVDIILNPPGERVPGGIFIRLRHPEGKPISGVQLEGKSYSGFNDEYIMIPDSHPGPVRIKALF